MVPCADPMDCGTIEVTYLNGQQSRFSLRRWAALSSSVRNGLFVYDFGVTAEDFRGLYYNDGTAST